MTVQRDDFDGPQGPNLLTAVRRLQLPALSRKVAAALAVVVLLVIGAAVAMTYPRRAAVPASGDAPLIAADATPYRVRPQDPGGMTIPYRDSTVFNALHGGDSQTASANDGEGGGKVENLLGLPEQPLPRDKIFPGAPPAVAVPNVAPNAVNNTTPPAAPLQPPPATVAPPAAKVAVAPAAVPLSDDIKPATAAEPASGDMNGDSYIQLGAVRSADEAQGVWTKAKAGAPDALGDLTLHVRKAELPKGTFYRVQAGPLSVDKAKALCATLNAKKAGSCLVARS